MTPEWLDPLMKYLVVPLTAWNWRLHSNQAGHKTEIEVLKAQMNAQAAIQAEAQRSNSKRFDAIMAKLDSIEQALRK